MTNPQNDTGVARHDTDAIIEAARLGVEPTELDLGKVYTRTNADGSITLIDLTSAANLQALDALAKRDGKQPARKTGTVALTEHASLSQYVTEHGEELATELWADRDRGRIVAVLNGHIRSDDGAGWADHRAVLTLRHTAAWKAWTGASGTMVGQEDFAEFLEAHRVDIRVPDAATLLEVVTTLSQNTSVAFKSAIRLTDGQTQLRYEETTDTRAGQAGDLKVPSEIVLGIAPYEGMDPFRLTARLQTRVRDGRLTIGVVLDQVDDVLRSAFEQVVAEVATATDLAVLHGTPIGG